MYKINKITPAGQDWWHVEIEGPNEIHIPMKQIGNGASYEQVWTRAQNWCDERNFPKTMYKRTARNWATVNRERKK